MNLAQLINNKKINQKVIEKTLNWYKLIRNAYNFQGEIDPKYIENFFRNFWINELMYSKNTKFWDWFIVHYFKLKFSQYLKEISHDQVNHVYAATNYPPLSLKGKMWEYMAKLVESKQDVIDSRKIIKEFPVLIEDIEVNLEYFHLKSLQRHDTIYNKLRNLIDKIEKFFENEK